MSLKRTYLVSFACLLISFGAAMAQDAPAPPAVPTTPDAPGRIFLLHGEWKFPGHLSGRNHARKYGTIQFARGSGRCGFESR